MQLTDSKSVVTFVLLNHQFHTRSWSGPCSALQGGEASSGWPSFGQMVNNCCTWHILPLHLPASHMFLYSWLVDALQVTPDHPEGSTLRLIPLRIHRRMSPWWAVAAVDYQWERGDVHAEILQHIRQPYHWVAGNLGALLCGQSLKHGQWTWRKFINRVSSLRKDLCESLDDIA